MFVLKVYAGATLLAAVRRGLNQPGVMIRKTFYNFLAYFIADIFSAPSIGLKNMTGIKSNCLSYGQHQALG